MLSKFSRLFSTTARTNHLIAAGWSIPAPDKKDKRGEDAYYTSERAVAIADGVGGWTSMGVDPGKYSRELMAQVKAALNDLPEDIRHHPEAVITKAASLNQEIGSSTCSLAILDPSKPLIYTGNIGDSGFLVLRGKNDTVEIAHRSTAVIHGFNFPFQIGTHGDEPKSGHYEAMEVKDKDVIVMFTDGVSDNLYESKILSLVKPFIQLPEIPDFEIIAEMVCETAYEHSMDPKSPSPFADAAKSSKAGGWEGGKPDDITVVIAQIRLEGEHKEE